MAGRRFIDSLRLWKAVPGPITPGGGTTLPKYRSLAAAVCGRVDKVLFDRDGVPFAGGGQPRYRIKWENGMLDTGKFTLSAWVAVLRTTRVLRAIYISWRKGYFPPVPLC